MTQTHMSEEGDGLYDVNRSLYSNRVYLVVTTISNLPDDPSFIPLTTDSFRPTNLSTQNKKKKDLIGTFSRV